MTKMSAYEIIFETEYTNRIEYVKRNVVHEQRDFEL